MCVGNPYNSANYWNLRSLANLLGTELALVSSMENKSQTVTGEDIASRTIEQNEKRFVREITSLLKSLKSDICDDYRASDDPDDNTPGMQVTVSTDDFLSWHYQTGDNSYYGGCYGDAHWGVIYLYRRSNSLELAKQAVDEMAELFSESI